MTGTWINISSQIKPKIAMSNTALNILVLENNPEHAESFKTYLSSTCFHKANLESCDSLAAGVAVLKKTAIDIAFLDLSLKDSPQIDTLAQLKAISSYCPAIVLASVDDRQTINEIIEKGADDCIPKSELNGFVLERAIHHNLSKREAANRLKQSEQTLKALLDTVPVSIIEHDDQGTIFKANSYAREIFGLEKASTATHYGSALWQRLSSEVRLPFISNNSSSPADADKSPSIFAELVDQSKSFVINSVELSEASQGSKLFISCFSDVTERHTLEQALKTSLNRNELAQRLYGVGVWEWKIPTNQVFWSKEMFSMWGVTEEAFSCEFEDVKSLIHPDDVNIWLNNVETSLKTGQDHEMTFRIVKPSGELCWIYALGTCEFKNGVPLMMTGVCKDITAEKAQQEKLLRAASVFANAQEGIIITDASGNIVEVNQAFTNITGLSESDAVGNKPNIMKSGKHDASFYKKLWQDLLSTGHWQGEMWNKRNDGSLFAERLTITAVKGELSETLYYVGIFSDITDKKAYEELLKQEAHLDELTQLPNRRGLLSAIESKLTAAQKKNIALLFLDLDGFKAINDNYGHAHGDELLVMLSKRLLAKVRNEDVVARIGGDEFIILANDVSNIELVKLLSERIIKACAEPVALQNAEVTVSASVGVLFVDSGAQITIDELISKADQAMYQAKNAGKNRYVLETIL